MEFAFPKHKWEMWKFPKSPAGFWASASESRSAETVAILATLLNQIKQRNHLQTMDDWYRVNKLMIGHANRSRLKNFGGLQSALRLVFPSHPWNPLLFGTPMKKSIQHSILTYSSKLFQSTDQLKVIQGNQVT